MDGNKVLLLSSSLKKVFFPKPPYVTLLSFQVSSASLRFLFLFFYLTNFPVSFFSYLFHFFIVSLCCVYMCILSCFFFFSVMWFYFWFSWYITSVWFVPLLYHFSSVDIFHLVHCRVSVTQTDFVIEFLPFKIVSRTIAHACPELKREYLKT